MAFNILNRVPVDIWMAVFQQLADEFVQELLKIHCHELTSTTSRIESRRAIEALSLSCRFLSHLAQPFLFAHLSSHQVENRMAHRDHEQATPEYVKDRLGLFRSPRYSPFVRYVRIGFSVSEINRQPLETVWRSWGILEALPSFLKLAVIDLANVTLDRGQLEALSRVGSNVLFCRLTVCSLEEGSTIPATLQIRARKVELCGNSHPHDRSEPFIPFFLSSKQTRELSIRGVRDVALTLHSLTLYPEAAAQVEVLQLRFKTSRPFSDSALSPVLSMFTSLRRLKFTGWIRGAAPGLAAINPIPSTALQSLEALDTWLESVTFFSQLPNVKDVYFMGLATRLHVHANSPLVRPFFSRLERLCFQLAVVANEDLRSMSAALKDAFSNLSWLEIEMSSTDTPIWVVIKPFLSGGLPPSLEVIRVSVGCTSTSSEPQQDWDERTGLDGGVPAILRACARSLPKHTSLTCWRIQMEVYSRSEALYAHLDVQTREMVVRVTERDDSSECSKCKGMDEIWS